MLCRKKLSNSGVENLDQITGHLRAAITQISYAMMFMKPEGCRTNEQINSGFEAKRDGFTKVANEHKFTEAAVVEISFIIQGNGTVTNVAVVSIKHSDR